MNSIKKLENVRVLDVNVFLFNYEGLSIDIQRSALDSFLSEGEGFVKKIISSAVSQEHELQRSLHSLKTMSRFIGASRIAVICELIEKLDKDNDEQLLANALAQEWAALKKVVEKNKIDLFENKNDIKID